jgi:hypothetical protein
MAKKKVAEEKRNTRMAIQQPLKRSGFPDLPRGMDLLERRRLNKGTAFTEDELSKHGLRGLLPPHVESVDEQVVRAYEAYKRKDDDLERYIYLRVLQHTNEVLFYRLLLDHIDGASFEYDSLIVSAGSQISYYGHDAWREWAPGMKSVEEATNIRHKILYAFAAQRLASHRQERSGRSRTPLGRYRQEPHAVRQPLLRLSRLRNGRPVVRGEFDVLMRVAAHRSHSLTDAIESLPSGLHRPKHKEHHDILFSDAA